MMSNLKLGVEVDSAHELVPQDGQGAANAFVELHFDGQKYRTAIKDRDLNPFWNERFYFNITDPSVLSDKVLEAFVNHVNRTKNSKTCLGKVRIAGTSFVGHSDAAILYYPLEKARMLSRVRGELGLKIFLTDTPTAMASNRVQEFDTFMSNPPSVQLQQELQDDTMNNNPAINPFTEGRATSVRQFQHLPRDQQRPPSPSSLSQQQYYAESQIGEQPTRYKTDAEEKRSEAPRMVRMFSSAAQQPVDFQLKETSPKLGGGRVVRGRVIPGEKAGAYDLVERMHYLFVRVVKARNLPNKDVTGSLDPYVELRLGNYIMNTRHFEKTHRPEWDEVFAFPQDLVQSSTLEVFVMDKDLVRDDFVGRVRFDLNEVPTRVPPDSPLAPEWYRLEDNRGEHNRGEHDRGERNRGEHRGELMLAVWIGTQADECFPNALHAGPRDIDANMHQHIRGKVYPGPRLWYVRVNVIDAQDIHHGDRNRFPEAFVKVRIGNQILKTKVARSQTATFTWNEDLMFVAAEPFEDDLIITVEDRVGHNRDEIVGELELPLMSLRRRGDSKQIPSMWYDLRRPGIIDINLLRDFAAKIHLRVCLEGGYHVLDESTQYSSDLRPTMKQLWKPPIGLLEVGILGVDGLHPIKTREGRGTSDAYCVAKYGQKWIRTRTIVDNLNPKFNEQYTWDVHDHGTVLTVGVFDNSHVNERSANPNGNRHHRDAAIGKVRIRLSTLETGRVYTHTYPLLVLHNSGVKKMGELHLAIRFSATSLLNVFQTYSRPLLPKMHYIYPLTMTQQEMLRFQAVQIVAQRLGRMEPPVRKEVVEYMSDANAHLWSMRRSKANFYRLLAVFSGILAAWRWFGEVCQWKNPVTTVLVHVLFVMLICYPDLILPTIFLYMFLIGLWNYRFRPQYPPHMNTRISHADTANPDELDEEFDTFPSTRNPEVVRFRYDRLRHVAGRIQTAVGDIATQGERLQSLLSWRDPRATIMFLVFCLFTATTLYVTPLQVIALGIGFYSMRHPRFRHKVPSAPLNFFRRLPAKTDTLL